MAMTLTPYLKSEVSGGNVVLLLGSGASLEARDASGNAPPKTAELAALIASRYLGGPHPELTLAQAAEYAGHVGGQFDVQDFIRDLLDPFLPSPAHLSIPTFSWRGIATTNYDRLVERAYEEVSGRQQRAVPLLSDRDRFDDVNRDPGAVALLKLHGCITRTRDSQCPLILTPDQYVRYKEYRKQLFNLLEQWGRERPVLFIGQSLSDPDLRELLLELTREVSRPQFFAVVKDAPEFVQGYWESKRVHVLPGTFREFMEALSAAVTPAARVLSGLMASGTSTHPIARHFTQSAHILSERLNRFLTSDVHYLGASTRGEIIDAARYYRGLNPGWSATEQGLDVPRHVTNTLLSEHVLEPPVDPGVVPLVLLRGPAGSGKTVVMKRLAWDAQHTYDQLCLYLQPSGELDHEAIRELLGLTECRILIFVDDGADRIRDLSACAKRLNDVATRLTFFIAERTNESNIAALEDLVTDVYELRHLTDVEIGGLIGLLERHRALGTLERKTAAERAGAFKRAGNQLLVALHEATLGLPFEDIVENEYHAVSPAEARRMYLTICVLNRLGVAVRAGLVSRIHGIGFEEFRARFFRPLEHVVYAEEDGAVRDYVYRTRHRDIAEIVFQRVLRSPEQRYSEYEACLGALNLGYSVDRQAFRRLLRGKALGDLFPDHEMVKAIEDQAFRISPSDGYLWHQFALYEMNRANGNLDRAHEFLARAGERSPGDLTVKHSRSELALKRAETSRSPLERERALSEAETLSSELRRDPVEGKYAFHTLAKIKLRELRDLLSREDTGENAIEQALRNAESVLVDGLQRYPDEPYLLDVDAQVAELVKNTARAVRSLEMAFGANPRSTFVAIRLARLREDSGDVAGARDVLERALEVNRGERRLHFQYAELLLRVDESAGDLLVYHLSRSFTPGDKNVTPQLLLGRQLFINGDLERSRAVFRDLSKISGERRLREARLFPLRGVFSGSIVRMEDTYLFLSRDGAGDWIYAHGAGCDEGTWGALSKGMRVKFSIAFNVRGAVAVDIVPESLA